MCAWHDMRSIASLSQFKTKNPQEKRDLKTRFMVKYKDCVVIYENY